MEKIKKLFGKMRNIDFKVNYDFQRLFTLTKREIRNSFLTPVSFLVFGLFIIIISIILFGVNQFLQYGRGELTEMFTAVAFAFVIIVPALTMGAISKEKQSGTIEFILTQPISEFSFLLSKFLANVLLLAILLALTIPFSLVVGFLTPLDFGQVAMQYFGSFLLGASFISIGIAVSSIFKSEIASLLISILISVLFIISGTQLLSFIPIGLQSIFEKISLLSHYQSLSRGVLDLRDLLYFFGFIFAFLSIAYYSIVSLKLPRKHKELMNTRLFLITSIVIAILIGILGQVIPGRLDLTQNQRFTLAQESRELISEIPENLNITFYSSGNLPAEFQSITRAVTDILRDYIIFSNNKIEVETKDPQSSEEIKTEALGKGVQELIFAVDSSDSTQRVAGFAGITFEYKERSQVINLSSEVSENLEFEISSKIKELVVEDKPDIGFITNNVSNSMLSNYRIFNSELSRLYDVVDLQLTNENSTIPENIKAIIIAGPNGEFGDLVTNSLKEYFTNGGSIFLLTDTITLSQESGLPQINANALSNLFEDYGVVVDSNLVYDLRQNNLIDLGGGTFVLPAEYPLWFIANQNPESKDILKNVSNISILWGSSISIDSSKSESTKVFKLFETTDEANVQNSDSINISLQQNFAPKDDDSIRTVVVGLENVNGGRAVVVGDSEFITDDLINELRARQQGLDTLNLSMALGSVEWISKESQLSSLRARNRLPTRLIIEDTQRVLLIASSVVIPITAIALSGLFVQMKRRRESKKIYAP